MIKHFIRSIATAVLAAGLVLGLCFTSEAAAVTTSNQDYRNSVFKACGLSDLSNLDQPQTRAEFAQMLVLCSSQKDLVGNTNVSAATDVPASNPYAKYIRVALKNSWMRNRLGGNFEPNGTVTLTDAAKAVMTMLGYSDSDFTGNVNDGRLSKFCSLGLNEGVKASGAYDTLTRQDAINVLYNALKTVPKQGNSILGTAINLSLSADGSLNANSVLDSTMKGPILIKNYSEIQENLPFPMAEGTFYYNGAKTSYYQSLQLLPYNSQLDNCGWLIIYYNEASKTVWGYGQDTGSNAYHCVRGTVNAINYDSENIASPTSILLNDTVYSLGNSDTKFMFSVNGSVAVGDEVIIICKQNTKTETAEEGLSTYYVTGVVMYNKRR